ncbi:MAG: hypothetical protein OXN84_18170 [Albidovulum sp.]|nr:hypothetical protein [Albidovulum sp.]
MKLRLLIAIAGVPRKMHDVFAKKTSGAIELIAFEPLDHTLHYSQSYCDCLYERLARNLKKRDQTLQDAELTRINVILLYVQKDKKSEMNLHQNFGTEVLLIPLPMHGILDVSLATPNQMDRAVNELIDQSRKAIKRAQALLSIIGEEVHNRDNKTCLLLPPNNYGKDFEKIRNCVQHACQTGQGRDEFRKCLDKVSQSLPKQREISRDYFVGRLKLVFRAPSKSGPRHGFARWEGKCHQEYCAVRGKIRFGSNYDSKFHYDCNITGKEGKCFPNCHGFKIIPSKRRHLNVAPNDNVR